MGGRARIGVASAVLVAAATMLVGCGGPERASDADGGGDVAANEDRGAASAAPDAGAESAGGEDQTANLLAPVEGEALIRTASVRLSSDDVGAAARSVSVLATTLSGTVASSDIRIAPEGDGESVALITLRIPADSFDEAMTSLARIGDVLDQQEDATDVAAEIADVDSRIASQRASVERIRALLAQAEDLTDVVTIEAELARREADLDALLARQAVLADQTSRATISVEVVGPAAAESADDRGFLSGLSAGWDAFVDTFIVALTVIGAVLPFVGLALVIGLPVALALRRRSAPRRLVDQRDDAGEHVGV